MEIMMKHLGEIITGNTPSKKNEEFWNSGDICFVKPDIISDNGVNQIFESNEYISERARKKARIVSKDSIFVTCIGSIGKIGIALEGEYAFNQQINVIVPNDKVVPKYLAYNLLYNKPRLALTANAPVVPIINKSQFGDFTINIDSDKNKQSEIAYVLDKLTHIIKLRNDELSALDDLIKARFVEMFGDPIINSKGWSEALIGDDCFVTKLAGFEYTQYINYDNSGDVVMVKAQNVKNGRLNRKELSFISSEVSDSLPRSQLAPGDIVMTYVGANIGDVAVIDDKYKYHLAPNVAKIRPDSEIYDSTYFMYMLMLLNTYIVKNSADTAKAALGMERIRKLKVFTPPIETQRQFADFVHQVDKSKFIQQII